MVSGDKNVALGRYGLRDLRICKEKLYFGSKLLHNTKNENEMLNQFHVQYKSIGNYRKVTKKIKIQKILK